MLNIFTLKQTAISTVLGLGLVAISLSGCSTDAMAAYDGKATQSAPQSRPSDRTKVAMDARQALNDLYKSNPAAAAIGKKSVAVLVFPSVVKGGLVFGGSYGEGAMLKEGKVVDYYTTASATWGLQAGAQSYSYVVFLMSKAALDQIDNSDGWELGVGPTVVVVDEGLAANLSTTTLQDDAYAFIYDQKGLMGGVSVEGTKITRKK
jgi:lipid-binding SYLF domain-containing protein